MKSVYVVLGNRSFFWSEIYVTHNLQLARYFNTTMQLWKIKRQWLWNFYQNWEEEIVIYYFYVLSTYLYSLFILCKNIKGEFSIMFIEIGVQHTQVSI